MKFIWTVLINLAIFIVLAAILVCVLIASDFNSSNCDKPLFDSTIEGYKNHQLIQFSPNSEIDVKKLVELQKKLDLVSWSNVLRPGWPFMLQVPPEQITALTITSQALHLPFVLLSSNLQDYLTNRKRVVSDFDLGKSQDFELNRYHYYTEIEKYLNKLAEEQIDRLLLNTYGSSIENRQLYYVRIFKSIEEAAKSEDKSVKEKKTVIFECGAHGREWLSPAVCLRFIDYLVYDEKSQPLLDEYEFYILPVINPDGYAYSWTKDRLWRKNRRRFANNCYGVDLNRNFNIGFNTSEIPEHIHSLGDFDIKNFPDLDSSNKTDLIRLKRFLAETESEESVQCSNLYGGERPFSENETFYLKRLIDRFLTKPSVYFSIHAYSQMWLYPYGIKQVSQNDDTLRHYAMLGVENLKKSRTNGTNWTFGRAIDIMYNAGGISIDWAHKDVGIELVYALEIRDSGFFGFLLPEDQIQPAAEEAWSGIKAVLEAYAEDLKNANNNVTSTEPSSL